MRCLGDCKESDFTETVSGVNFTVVTVDKSKVSGRIEASSEDRGFMIDGSEGLITMSGNVVVREDQKFRNNLIAVNGTTVANHLSWAQTFRTAIAFDNAGAIHFVLAGLDKQNNSIRQLPFCEDKTDHNIVLSRSRKGQVLLRYQVRKLFPLLVGIQHEERGYGSHARDSERRVQRLALGAAQRRQ